MIRPISFTANNIRFKENESNNKKDSKGKLKSTILPDTLSIRLRQKYEKTSNAFLKYVIKGLKGDVNSDFYEFLSMGVIPYLAGSAVLMGLFNLTGHINTKAKIFAQDKGRKMALGVAMYGLMKTISNDFVSKPVAMATGVNIDTPIIHVYSPLPTEGGKDANIIPQIQHRKVFDSKEFFRKDLIDEHPDYGKKYYDRIAKKLGLGENLNDSVTETTPIIQNLVSTTKTAKSLSSYAWAGLGVGIAVQDCWNDFFATITNRKKHIAKPNESFINKLGSKFKNFGTNTIDITKAFGKSFLKSWQALWTGKEGSQGFKKHTGKVAILLTLALTIGTTLNAIIRAKSMGKLSNKNVIDDKQESTVI